MPWVDESERKAKKRVGDSQLIALNYSDGNPNCGMPPGFEDEVVFLRIVEMKASS